MPSFLSQAITTVAGLASVAVANGQGNYFPPTPEGLKVVESKHQEGVKISYKEVFFLTLPNMYNIYSGIKANW